MRLYNKRANPFGKHKLTFKRLSLILSDAAMCNFVGGNIIINITFIVIDIY